MRLRYILTGKFADALYDGGFTVIGGGSPAAQADRFPFSLAVVAVVARLVADPEDYGHDFTVRLEYYAPDGARLPGDAEMRLAVPKSPKGSEPAGANCIFNMVNLPCPVPGRYEFRLFVDDQQVGDTEVYVVPQVDDK